MSGVITFVVPNKVDSFDLRLKSKFLGTGILVRFD